MKKHVFLFSIMAVFSCENKDTEQTFIYSPDGGDRALATHAVEAEPDQLQEITGYYVGYFEAVTYDGDKGQVYSNKISISVDSLGDRPQP